MTRQPSTHQSETPGGGPVGGGNDEAVGGRALTGRGAGRVPRRRPTVVPWARPRRELLLLALVAIAALSPLSVPNPQDTSRICLAEAMLRGHLSNDACLSGTVDYAEYGGHLYSDKAPGLSLIELPAVALLRPGPAPGWPNLDYRLWGVRVLSVGITLLACVFLVGRVAEGLAPGFGGVSLVVFALGTLVGPLASVSFEHVPAALLAFGAFLLAWRRRPFLAGLVGGAALLVEYETAIVLVALGAYVALGGLRPLRAYLGGLLPGAALLALYDWAAFGAPWHLSYRYVGSAFSAEQSSGFFGINAPRAAGLFAVFAGNGGLLFASPVLALAAVGLLRLGRTHRAEALTATFVIALVVLADAGYYLPYGGTSPGPRFLTTALPFLALGLGPAFAWRPRLTLALAALSVFTTTAISLGWASSVVMQQTVWAELARIPVELGHSRFVEGLSANVVAAVGLGDNAGALLIGVASLLALVLAARTMPWATIRARRPRGQPSLLTLLVTGGSLWLLLAVDVCSILAYPYGDGYQGRISPLVASIDVSPRSSYLGGEVNYTVTVSSVGPVLLNGIVLTVKLEQGMVLVGPPKVTLGGGCTGTETLECDLGYLAPGQSTTVYFGVQFSQPGDETLVVVPSSNGFAAPHSASSTVAVGR